MKQYYDFLNKNCWMYKTGKHCVLVSAEPINKLMKEFHVTQRVADAIIQSWVNATA